MSLSSIRTWGWFPSSAGGDASISSIRTWGWLFDEAAPPIETPVAAIFSLPIETLLTLSNEFNLPLENIANINIINNIPIEYIGITELGLNFDAPIEYNQGVAAFTTQQLPIEIIGRIINDFDIPIEVIGATLAWILDNRGTLWRVPERGNEWVRVGEVNMEWIVNERGPRC